MATTKSAATVEIEAARDHKPPAAAFSKRKVLTLKRYAGRRDLLSVLLEDDKAYTREQVDGLLQKFMKGKVN